MNDAGDFSFDPRATGCLVNAATSDRIRPRQELTSLGRWLSMVRSGDITRGNSEDAERRFLQILMIEGRRVSHSEPRENTRYLSAATSASMLTPCRT